MGGVGGSLAAVGMATLVAQLIYQRGWENIRELKVSKRKSVRRTNASKASYLERLRHAIGRGKITIYDAKDFLIFVRHSGRLIAIAMLTLFFGGSHRYLTRAGRQCGYERWTGAYGADSSL